MAVALGVAATESGGGDGLGCIVGGETGGGGLGGGGEGEIGGHGINGLHVLFQAFGAAHLLLDLAPLVF